VWRSSTSHGGGVESRRGQPEVQRGLVDADDLEPGAQSRRQVVRGPEGGPGLGASVEADADRGEPLPVPPGGHDRDGAGGAVEQPVPDAADEETADGGAVGDADRDEPRLPAPGEAVQAFGRGVAGDRLLADVVVAEPLEHLERLGAERHRDLRVRRVRGSDREDVRDRLVDGGGDHLIGRGRGKPLREAQSRLGGWAAVVAGDDGTRGEGVGHGPFRWQLRAVGHRGGLGGHADSLHRRRDGRIRDRHGSRCGKPAAGLRAVVPPGLDLRQWCLVS
jgi:hypothetical protein